MAIGRADEKNGKGTREKVGEGHEGAKGKGKRRKQARM